MADVLRLDAKEFDALVAKVKDFGDGAEGVINEVFEEFGTKEVEEKIQQLLPSSGRTWKGKARAAKSTQPFRDEMGNLSFTVRSKPRYQYLYFPDDGTNTRRHIGKDGKPRRFMQRGAEQAKQPIIERCIASLVKDF